MTDTARPDVPDASDLRRVVDEVLVLLADLTCRTAPTPVRRTLDRLFPDAVRTADPWHDLLTAGGRTPQTRDQRWTWDSTVRPTYGPRQDGRRGP